MSARKNGHMQLKSINKPDIFHYLLMKNIVSFLEKRSLTKKRHSKGGHRCDAILPLNPP